MWSFLKAGFYLINVDECSFSKSIKQNYSWLSKGERGPIINIKCKGSANAIFALGWDGEWIWAIYNNSTTSKRFYQFLVLVRAYALLVLSRTTKEIKIAMDNAAIHVLKMSQRATFNLNLEVHWLHQYFPTLAPVELVFGMVKGKLASMNSKVWIDFNKEGDKKTITKWIGELDSKAGFKMWERFIKTSRSVMLRWLILLSQSKFIQNKEKHPGVEDMKE